MENKNYYLGLDIGTDSVGYAVTDENYNLLRFHGEHAWGVTLFDEAALCTDRRAHRTARRRLDRRKQRVDLLQELFAVEIGKVDPRFFIRLQESALYREDAGDAYSFFNDENYTDIDYHKQYPTIHHLIVDLMTSSKPHDVRLVYLACAWLVAHRGHFLSDVNKENISELTDFTKVYDNLLAYFAENELPAPWGDCDRAAFADVLKRKTGLSYKQKLLAGILYADGKLPKTAEDDPYAKDVLIKAICGSKVKCSDLFNNTEYEELDTNGFCLGADEETLAGVMANLSDADADLFARLKATYDWAVLVDALNGQDCISLSKVAVYDQHKKDLATLKYFIRKYANEKYAEVFRKSAETNYVAYSYHNKNKNITLPKKKANKEDFCKYVKGIIAAFKGKVEEKDAAAYADMVDRLDLLTFLPKQRDTDNRVIPYQLYWYELKKIMEKAGTYLPFLSASDADGIRTDEKIMDVFTFRVPYFVGPLNKHSNRGWIERQPGKIYPWNFEKMVDLDKCEEAFIKKLINYCTYIPGEKVLPKESLTYAKFMVLNEINNLKIDEQPISVELKQIIYYELFCKKRRVTRKALEEYLLSNNHMAKGQHVSGIDEQIKSSLKAYHDFKRLLANKVLTEEQVEAIIERITYVENPARVRAWLKKNYAFLSDADVTYIAKLKYKDFGRLSYAYLNGLEGCETDSATGEAATILSAMWNTNNNQMELMSDRFTYRQSVLDLQEQYYATHSKTLAERLDDMYLSNAVKRPVIRALEITKDVVKAFGGAPAKVFVEMTRGATEDQKNKRTKTRLQQLRELYEKCKQDARDLNAQLDAMGDNADNCLQSDALFLYYLQIGKCLYTGNTIDITALKSGRYNIEHIYPQSLVKDDSIINNEILVESNANGAKSDSYPVAVDIQNKQGALWSMLHHAGLMSDEKYKRLTRTTPFSADEKMGFINRQLTETSQSTKAVATLLKELYHTEIVYVKARLTSEFRQEYGLLKSRTVNDLHHAKDAYLNIVTGNVYSMRFTKQFFRIDEQYSLNTWALFGHSVICGGKTVWTPAMLDTVKKTAVMDTAHLTRYAYCKHGPLFDLMPLKAGQGQIEQKAGKSVEKYGGYNKAAISFCLIVGYKTDKAKDVMIMPVELLFADRVLASADFAATYAQDKIGRMLNKPVHDITFPCGMRMIRINTVFALDGFRGYYTGITATNWCFSSFMPLSLKGEWQNYIKHLESFAEKTKKNPGLTYQKTYDKISCEKNIELYDVLCDKLANSIYQKRPGNPVDTIGKGKSKFATLDVKVQVQQLLSLLQVFGPTSGGIDLTQIGGAAKAATTRIGLSITTLSHSFTHSIVIIDQSPSGLWESQSINLLDLIK